MSNADPTTCETPPRPVSPHTISQRFLITLMAQASKSGFSFLTGLVIARSLGPVEYGNLAFLLGSFTGIRIILDSGTSSAFFTLAAQRPRSLKFFQYYAGWLLLFEFLLPFLVIWAILPDNVISVLWQSQNRERVWLAFLAANLQYFAWPQAVQLGEIVRRTLVSQVVTIVISAAQFAIITFLVIFGWLTVSTFFAATIGCFLVGAVVAALLLPRPWHSNAPPDRLSTIVGEFARFCRPLIPSYALQAANGWVEVWLIQHFAGAREQAYYALGMQISLIGLVATAALQNIFWREFAELDLVVDASLVRHTYLKTSRLLLFAAAAPITFLVPWTSDIVHFALGTQYGPAVPTVAILFAFPLSQCLATLAYVVFAVRHETKFIALMSGSAAFLNMIGAYFILAPAPFGQHGGSEDMAIKVVVISLLQTIVLEYFMNRSRGWHHDWVWRSAMLVTLLAISALTFLVARPFEPHVPVKFLIVGDAILFGMLVITVVLRWPSLIGLERDDRDRYIRAVKRYAGGR